MEIKTELTDLYDFEAWSGATSTKDAIIAAGKGEEFISALEDAYPDGMTDTELNDLLWFEPEYCYELAGLDENGEEPSEEDEEEDEEDEDDEEEDKEEQDDSDEE